jgi:hypothetical protein
VHVPKSSIGADLKTDPEAFGSVFFTNLCRMSWAVKKQPGATKDLVTVGLFPKKQNDGERADPTGLEFRFSRDRIDVQSVDLATVEGLAQRLWFSSQPGVDHERVRRQKGLLLAASDCHVA